MPSLLRSRSPTVPRADWVTLARTVCIGRAAARPRGRRFERWKPPPERGLPAARRASQPLSGFLLPLQALPGFTPMLARKSRSSLGIWPQFCGGAPGPAGVPSEPSSRPEKAHSSSRSPVRPSYLPLPVISPGEGVAGHAHSEGDERRHHHELSHLSPLSPRPPDADAAKVSVPAITRTTTFAVTRCVRWRRARPPRRM